LAGESCDKAGAQIAKGQALRPSNSCSKSQQSCTTTGTESDFYLILGKKLSENLADGGALRKLSGNLSCPLKR
jgi:hypothetical protein